MLANVAMQILVADFGERQRPVGRDGHARIRGWMPHEPRYKICMVLAIRRFLKVELLLCQRAAS
jgi:hypothetical protein